MVQGWEPWRPGRRPTLPGLGKVIGHRGAMASAPENTLASMRRARELGATWIELDVKLTADGVPILMHDDTLDRTTSGTGPVATTTWADIEKLDAGSWFGPAFVGEHVPTFAAALTELARLALGINVEIKPCPGREVETAEIAAEHVRRHRQSPAASPILFSSFALGSLEAVRRRAPEIPRGYLCSEVPADWAETMQRLECTTLHPWQKKIDAVQVHALRAAGVPTLIYTVNEAARARLLYDAGATAIITDAPDRIIAAIAD